MAEKSYKRKFVWVIENVTFDKIRNHEFQHSSDAVAIDFGDNKTEW